MKKVVVGIISIIAVIVVTKTTAGVYKDIYDLQTHFLSSFPDKSLQNFQDGPYVFDKDKRFQFNAIMEFPPFEDLLKKGEELWQTPFKNGNTFASCFDTDVANIRPDYPKWDSKTKKVITLETAINNCRVKNNESKWGWKKGNIAYIGAYLTTAAVGKKINVVIPNDPDAEAAYNAGKNFYYAKRGQLNMSCADCHVYNPGKRIRGNILSTTVGQITHFPVWRGKWARQTEGKDGFGTLQRRFSGCNKQVRAKPFKAQQQEYNNLEYFLSAMSNGVTYNGTAYRE